jgi:hypothetical protein
MPFIDPTDAAPKKARHFPSSPLHLGGPLTPTVPGRQLNVPTTPIMMGYGYMVSRERTR